MTSFGVTLERQTVGYGYGRADCYSLYDLFLCVFQETNDPNIDPSLFKVQHLLQLLVPLLVKNISEICQPSHAGSCFSIECFSNQQLQDEI